MAGGRAGAGSGRVEVVKKDGGKEKVGRGVYRKKGETMM